MALGHETRLKAFNRIEIILNVFRDDIRIKLEITNKKYIGRGFPGGAVVENLPANAGDMGLSPGLGRSHMPRSN